MQVPGLPCAGPLSHATSCDPVDSLAAGVSSAVRLPARALVFACLAGLLHARWKLGKFHVHRRQGKQQYEPLQQV